MLRHLFSIQPDRMLTGTALEQHKARRGARKILMFAAYEARAEGKRAIGVAHLMRAIGREHPEILRPSGNRQLVPVPNKEKLSLEHEAQELLLGLDANLNSLQIAHQVRARF